MIAVCASGFVLFGGAIVGTQAFGLPDWLWIPGFLGFGVAWVTAFVTTMTGIGFRCPDCRANLAFLFLHGPGWQLRRVSVRVRYCPYCGCDFDAEPPPSPGQATPFG